MYYEWCELCVMWIMSELWVMKLSELCEISEIMWNKWNKWIMSDETEINKFRKKKATQNKNWFSKRITLILYF